MGPLGAVDGEGDPDASLLWDITDWNEEMIFGRKAWGLELIIQSPCSQEEGPTLFLLLLRCCFLFGFRFFLCHSSLTSS